MNTSLPRETKSGRAPAPFRLSFSGTIALVALAASCALCVVRPSCALGADGSAFPLSNPTPRPHAVGDVFNYSLHGTLSQSIVGHDPFGRQIHQSATPTDLQGRERIAIKSISIRGLALHRSGSILATFNGKSSPAQPGTGWTLVTPQGDVQDRKGSTLGGLFLLPLAFLGDRAVNGGTLPNVGDRWKGKLGMALFGMTAQPRLQYQVTGARRVFGVAVISLTASGNAPVREPIVTNEGVALGNAVGTAHLTLRCDYDPVSLRAVSMDIAISGDLHIRSSKRGAAANVRDRQHYLVALDAQSIQLGQPVLDPPAPQPVATLPPGRR